LSISIFFPPEEIMRIVTIFEHRQRAVVTRRATAVIPGNPLRGAG
jgi:hypothetical protein